MGVVGEPVFMCFQVVSALIKKYRRRTLSLKDFLLTYSKKDSEPSSYFLCQYQEAETNMFVVLA